MIILFAFVCLSALYHDIYNCLVSVVDKLTHTDHSDVMLLEYHQSRV